MMTLTWNSQPVNCLWAACTLIDWLIDLRPCQHDNGYVDGRSQIKLQVDERT